MTQPVLDLQPQKERAETFRALHDAPPLVLANAWDAGSAHLIAGAGATAIATSSGAQSWAQGLPDGHNLPIEDVLANVRRIAAVRSAADRYGVALFIHARTDVFLFAVGEEPGRLDDVLARAAAYREAGADGIFAPGLLDPAALRRLADESGLKVNAMWLPGAPPVSDLADAGVTRFSAGTAIAQVAYTAARDAARALLDNGDDAALASSIDYFSMNGEFGG